MTNRICFKCANSDQHQAKECPEEDPVCKICNKAHPTCLHNPAKHGEYDQTSPKSACTKICGDSQLGRSCARIVLLQAFHESNPTVRVPTYAVLDDQSTDVFVTDTLLEQLGSSGPEITLNVNTIVGTNSIHTRKIAGLCIQDVEGRHKPIPVRYAYSREEIPADERDIATPEIAREWKHLEEIAHHIHHRPDIQIGMLIGRNVPTAFQPLNIIYGDENEPWAEEYKFGWTIIGKVCLEEETPNVTVNRVSVIDEDVSSSYDQRVAFRSNTPSKDITSPKEVSEMMQLDYNEVHYSRNIRGTEQVESPEDRRFNQILTKGIHKNSEGNWEMPLPFREDDHEISLPNNRDYCVRRLLNLKKKLQKDDKLRGDYVQFMKKIIEREHATPVPEEELRAAAGKVWYLPHFQVYHPKKPDQVRVVFDCSAVFEGVSLNTHLLQGPDWMNALVGVLSRFRKEEVGVSCDIEQMFHNFKVDPEHRDFLRFLWFKDGALDQPLVEYRMNVHLFGAVSSPGVANFGLLTTAKEGRQEFGDEAADFLENDFYVDDGLKSFGSPEEAISTIKAAQSMCSSANLRLHKFASNDKSVLESLPSDDRSKDLKDLDLRHDTLPIQRSLGTYWCMESDTFGFRIELKDKPCTRRGLLSTVSSIYDPLGILAPVVLVGRQILQELCKEGLDWDEPLTSDIRTRWERWRSDLPLLDQVRVSRCLKPKGFGEPSSVEIHSFSDASDVGIGQVSYLRQINGKGDVHVSLLMAKGRVAPVKAMTTPRLELTAAVVSVNVSTMLKKELCYDDIEELYHSDSSVVLSYLNNEARRFHTYVGNRVQYIRDRSDPKQWHFVPGEQNPADVASRGCTAAELLQNRQWFNGPDFLWKQRTALSHSQPDIELDPDDREIKKGSTSVLSTKKLPTEEEAAARSDDLEAERFAHSSSLTRLKRGIVRIQRMIERKRSNKLYNWRPQEGAPTVKELEEAETVILKSLQHKHFAAEFKVLRKLKGNDERFEDRKSARNRNTALRSSSNLYKLDPFIDSKGLLRVGGRLKNSTSPFHVRYPVIIPKNDHVTTLLVRHHHENQHHQGYGITHNKIRQEGYWLINGRSEVSRVIRKCVSCRRLRGSTLDQKMSDLPSDRVNPAPPFTHTGMDAFGPFLIKEGRKELKRWGLIFTCLLSRGVHLETLSNMTTDSFINALRRFIGRRGKVQLLRSDQGSNFVGGRNELATALQELDNDIIDNFLSSKGCDWIKFDMNVPRASHMGGVWERLIRTVRSVLSALLREHGTQLDDESLRTLMVETEAIVNCRPLTVENLTESGTPEPITPNHLLTLKTSAVLPLPGNFTRPDLYSRKRWRRIQFLADNFWRRWREEYCNMINCERKKWQKTRRNCLVGDIVILREESPRNDWKLGRIVKVYPSSDGLVRKVRVLHRSGADSIGEFDRPVHKLVLLLGRDEVEQNCREDQEDPRRGAV